MFKPALTEKVLQKIRLIDKNKLVINLLVNF